MRKKYRVRRPKVRFGSLLFPLVSLVLLLGTVYSWINFVNFSPNDFQSTDTTDFETSKPLPTVKAEVLPVRQEDEDIIAVPGGVLPPEVPEVASITLHEGFGAIPSGKWIAVQKSSLKLMLCEGARILAEYPVGVGKNVGNKEKAGDARTPEGRFSIEKVQDASSWTYDYKDGRGPVKGIYGPWFLRLRMPWSGLGICGTPDPKLVGKRTTRGSIRMLNKDIEALRQKIRSGTPVIIMP